jgi:hypothetical protein
VRQTLWPGDSLDAVASRGTLRIWKRNEVARTSYLLCRAPECIHGDIMPKHTHSLRLCLSKLHLKKRKISSQLECVCVQRTWRRERERVCVCLTYPSVCVCVSWLWKTRIHKEHRSVTEGGSTEKGAIRLSLVTRKKINKPRAEPVKPTYVDG